MIYKNSIKLLFSNFKLVWKILIYALIVAVIAGGIAVACLVPVYKALLQVDFFVQFAEVFRQFFTQLNLSALVTNFGDVLQLFFTCIGNNIKDLIPYIILLVIDWFILFSVLKGFLRLVLTDINYLYMTSLSKKGFVVSFNEQIVKNIKLELTARFVMLPIDALFWLSLYGVFLMFYIPVAVIFAPFMVILSTVLLYSLKLTLYSCWVPIMVVNNSGIFKSLKQNFLVVRKNFLRIFSNSVCLVLTIITVNVFAAICTLGVTLFITIPLASMVTNLFGIVSYFECRGLKYYSDAENIISPKKMEFYDKLYDVKYIV